MQFRPMAKAKDVLESGEGYRITSYRKGDELRFEGWAPEKNPAPAKEVYKKGETPPARYRRLGDKATQQAAITLCEEHYVALCHCTQDEEAGGADESTKRKRFAP